MAFNPCDFENGLRLARRTMQEVNGSAYKDLFLLSNQVLSKNPYTNDYLKKIIFGVPARTVPLYEMLLNLAKYYLHSLITLIVHFCTFLSFQIFCRKARHDQKDLRELVLVDTFFLTDSIVRKQTFEDIYFPGIEDVLRKANKAYAYLPVFYGALGPLSVRSVFRVIDREKIPVLCEYELIRVFDYISLLHFVLVYPFRVIGLTKNIECNTRESLLLVEELLCTLHQVTLHGYLRYLVGKRLSQLPCQRLKLISWYENQVIDKNLYKGLRDNNGKSTIYGAQLFLYTKMDLNVPADETEAVFGLIPDKILVNGRALMHEMKDRKYDVGPSFRYRDLFKSEVVPNEQQDLLVVLPYQKEDAQFVLEMIRDARITRYNVFIKEHPAQSGRMRNRVVIDADRPNHSFTDENIYDLFHSTRLVIGASSGSLLEAATMAIPVILIRNPRTLNNSLFPAYGKGIIWDEVSTSEELSDKIDHFLTVFNERHEDMADVAKEYRAMFFCEPTLARAMEAFDLGSS